MTKSPETGHRAALDTNVTALLPKEYEAAPAPLKRLLEMLTYKRPHGSKSERKFINRFIMPLGVVKDNFGNLYKRVGKDSRVLWSCHTDTVHRTSGRQRVRMDDAGWAYAITDECLGADCAAGVWLMTEMIRREVPGLYVFHRDEESGGRGSTFIANHYRELLEGIDYAIAFDRKGFGSVITHQWGGRCCSNAFADALASTLGAGWQKDDGGTFTDTAMYADFVPECSNISVGYVDQHTSRECLYTPFIVDLLEKLCELDVEALPVARDPKAYAHMDDDRTSPYENRYYRAAYGYGYDDYSGYGAYGTWDDYEPNTRKLSARYRLLEAINDHPDAVAELLEEYGIGADEILMKVYSSR
ncbi:hypothetical protein GGR34_000727 [Microvirga flocculans]|uniref:Peptidase M28 domain-containing protein n=1 Tax=Microvirga flocculans TaxID=217168 RepID=A0A7W6N6Y7_9HYPH|nr:hypothetical protein [Microvirga flocculans]MBB4039092.1 hypothetical protein [Microvirga flocculans]